MLSAATVDEFLRDPVGRFCREATFTVWCLDPTLLGAIYRGWPNESGLRTLFQLLAIDAHPRMRVPFDVLTDARFVEGMDDASYRAIAAYLRGRLPDYARRIRRNAVVRPEGVIGSTVLGVYGMVKPSHAWAAFADVPEALAWLGRPDPASRELVAELTRISAEGAALVVDALRALLAASAPQAPRLEEVAAALGMAKRTLQRTLHEAGVAFPAEVRRARLACPCTPREAAEKVERAAGYASRSGLWKATRRT